MGSMGESAAGPGLGQVFVSCGSSGSRHRGSSHGEAPLPGRQAEGGKYEAKQKSRLQRGDARERSGDPDGRNGVGTERLDNLFRKMGTGAHNSDLNRAKRELWPLRRATASEPRRSSAERETTTHETSSQQPESVRERQRRVDEAGPHGHVAARNAAFSDHGGRQSETRQGRHVSSENSFLNQGSAGGVECEQPVSAEARAPDADTSVQPVATGGACILPVAKNSDTGELRSPVALPSGHGIRCEREGDAVSTPSRVSDFEVGGRSLTGADEQPEALHVPHSSGGHRRSRGCLFEAHRRVPPDVHGGNFQGRRQRSGSSGGRPPNEKGRRPRLNSKPSSCPPSLCFSPPHAHTHRVAPASRLHSGAEERGREGGGGGGEGDHDGRCLALVNAETDIHSQDASDSAKWLRRALAHVDWIMTAQSGAAARKKGDRSSAVGICVLGSGSQLLRTVSRTQDHVIKQRRFTYPFPRTRRHAAAAQRVPSGASISACNESGSYSQCSCGPESDCWKRPMRTLAEEAAVAQEGSSSRPLHADVWEGEHVPPARTRAPGPALGGCREAADDEMRRGFEGRVSSHFVAGNREGGVTSESGPGSRHTSWISMPAAGYCGGPDFDLATGGRVAEQGREADDYAMMRPAPVSPRTNGAHGQRCRLFFPTSGSCSGSHRSSAPSSFEADRPYSLSGDTGPVSTNQQCRIQRGVALVRSASEALPTASATRHPPQAPHRHSFSAHRGSHGVLSGLFLLPARAGEGRPPKLPCVSPTATASAEPSGSSAASRPEQQRRRSEAELPLFEPDAPAQQGSTQSTPSSSQCGCPVALQVCDSESGGCIRDALVVSSDGTPTGNETDEDDFKGKRYIRAILQLIPELYSRHPPVLSLLLHDSHLPFFFPLHIAEVAAFASLLVQQPPEVASALRSACLHAAPSSGEMAQRQAPAEELEPTTWRCGRRAGRNCRDRRGGDGGRRNETPPLSGSFLSAEQTGRIRPRRSGECFAGAEKRVDAHQTYRAENAGQFVSERRHRWSSYESTTQREDDGLEKDEEIEPTPEGLPRSSRTRSVLSHGDDLPRVTRAVSWCSVSSLRSCRTSCSASPDSPGDPLEGSDTRSPSPLAPFSRAGYDTLESPVKQALWDAVSRYTSWASTEFSLSSLSSLARAANPLKTEGEVVVCRMNSSSSPGIRLPVSRMPSNAPTSSQMIVDRGASACRADAARIIQKGDARAAGTTRSPRRSASSGCSSLLISCCSATFVEWDSVPTATENQQSISQGFHSSFNSLPASCSSGVGIPASRDEAQLSDLQLRQAVTSSVAVSSSGGVPLLSGASERRVFPLRLPFHSAGSCPSLALPANRGEVWFLPDVGGDSHLEQKQFGPRACGLPSSAYGQTERERAKEAGFETSVWLHGCKDAHDAKERPRTECICPASWRREVSRGGATSASAPWVSPEGTSDRRLAKPPEGGLAGRSKPDEGEQCWRVATRVCVARAPVICPSSSSFDASRISCLPSAASAAVSGGASSACVMYADLWALFAGQQVPPIPLSQYVSRLQRLSQISAHECLIALLLISRVLCRRPYLPFCALNAYRLLLTACMVVTKAFSDSFYTNAMWARFGGVTVTELNRLEYAFLLLLDHQCFVTLDEFAAAFCLVKDVSRALPVDVCGLISARGQTFLEGTSDLLSSSLAPPSTAGVSPRAHATERPSPKRCMGSELGRQYEELGASTAGRVPEGRAAAVGVSRADPRTRFASVAKSGDVSMPSPSASSPTTAFSGPCAAPSPGSPPHARLLVHSPSTQLCRGAASVSLSVCGNLVSTGLLASDMMDASPSCVGVDLSRHRGGRSRLSALPCSAGVFRETQPRLFGKSPRRRGGRGKPTSPTLQSHAPCNQSRQSFPSGAPETLPRSRWLRRSSAFGAVPAHRSSWARGRRCRSHLSRGGCCAVSAQPQLPPRCSPSAFPASPGGAFAHETGTGRRLVESPEAVAQKHASSRRSSGPMDAGRASVHGERSWGQKSERKGAVEGESDDPAVAVKGAVDPVFYERLLILRACSLSFLRAHVKRVAGFEMKERQEGRPMGEATAGRGKGCRCAETAAAELDGLRVVSTPCGVLGHPARQPSSTHSEAGRETGMGDGTAQGSDRRESEMSRCGEEERYPRGLPVGSAGRRETTYKGGGHAEERQRQLAEAFNSVDWRVIENPVASLLFSSHPVMNASPFSP